MTRPTPPDLEFRAPDCPICDTETNPDGDSFSCENCGISWDRDGRKGEWFDPDAEQCSWVVHPFLTSRDPRIKDETYRCVLADGHQHGPRGTKHTNPDFHEWSGTDHRYHPHKVGEPIPYVHYMIAGARSACGKPGPMSHTPTGVSCQDCR